MDRYRLGVALVTASAIAWSTAGFFTRLIPLDTWTTLLWRGIFGAAGIFLFILVQERRSALDGFRVMGWPGWSFAVVSAAGMLCFIAALKHTSVAHVAVVYATVPFVAAGLAWLVLREIASRSAILASAAALAGVAVMVGLGADGSLLGDLYAFAMTAAMAVMMVIARKHRFIPMLPAVCMSALLSALVAAPFAAWVMPGGGPPEPCAVRARELGPGARSVHHRLANDSGGGDGADRGTRCAVGARLGIPGVRRDSG